MIFSQIKNESGKVIYDAPRLIITGDKTQSRRVVKPNEIAVGDCGQYITTDQKYKRIHHVVTIDRNGKSRLKCQVGNTYAVTPQRTQPQVYWCDCVPGEIRLAHEYHPISKLVVQEFWINRHPDTWRDWLAKTGWQPLYIKITAIRQERLQDISEEDAIAEGIQAMFDPELEYFLFTDYDNSFFHISPVTSYKTLWQRINTRKGKRWEDNPLVWVLAFEMQTKGISKRMNKQAKG